jgi:hypothetical protein
MHQIVAPKFVDHYPQHTAEGYAATNEKPSLFNRLLNGLGITKVPRIACIASGGEMLLSVFLERADEIVAFDHSYRSLAVCYSKLLALQSMSKQELLEFYETLYNDYYVGNRGKRELPGVVLNALPTPLQKYADRAVMVYDAGAIYPVWRDLEVPPVTPEAVQKITLLHGDISDVEPLYGKFDLLYTSNLHEHANREGKLPNLDALSGLLKSGGMLLYTHGYNTYQVPTTSFETLQTVRAGSWTYVVARKL